jgi:hypothetical protein
MEKQTSTTLKNRLKIAAGNDVIVNAFSAGWTNLNLYTDS